MKLKEENIKFDPGFILHLQAFIPTVEDIYGKINRFKNFGQKRNMFKNYYPKLKQLLDSYIGFYLGCVLWAIVLKQESNKPVIGNLCYGGVYDEDTLFEVDFVKGFAEQLPKDAKYYLNEIYEVKDYENKILDLYREFLAINEGFVTLQNTDEIKLPTGMKDLSEKEIDKIQKVVEEVIQDGSFEKFYEIRDFVL